MAEVHLQLRTDRKTSRSTVPVLRTAQKRDRVLGPSVHRRPSRDGASLRALPRLGAWARSDRTVRALNVAIASVTLLVATPFVAAIGLLIKLTSPGPVFYKNLRVGIDRRDGGGYGNNCRRKVDFGGRLFEMYKFRTMYQSPDGGKTQVWARPDDPRVTPVGRVLRKYRVDELPNLINVLRGEMNIVGPRPEQPEIFEKLQSEVEGYSARQRVYPGITGWAQVNHHYDRSVTDVERKLTYDLDYISHRSVVADLNILLRTVPAVLLRRGGW